jgi:hypothetical protein
MGWNTEQVETVLSNPSGQTAGFDNSVVLYRMLKGLAKQLPETETFLLGVAKSSAKYQNLTQRQAEYVAKGLGKYVEALVALSNAPKQAVESPVKGSNGLAGMLTATDRLKALSDLEKPISRMLSEEDSAQGRRRKAKVSKTELARQRAKVSESERAFLHLLENFETIYPAEEGKAA